ncbi:hypothetical protein [Dendronalium phyllosphericum]|nr:hypothetical protein [Dendronalium phyllosphericum]
MPENLPSETNEMAELAIEALTTSSQPVNRMILIGAPEWVKGVIY